MADPFAPYLSQLRGVDTPSDEPADDDGLTGLSSVDDLRGTVFDTSDPIASWRKTNFEKKPENIAQKAMRLLTSPVEAIRKPLSDWGEQQVESATNEPNPALRALKAYPGAVAETVGEMASPLGGASLAAGPLGVGARSMIAGAQLGTGVPELAAGVRSGDTKQMIRGAGSTALGALGLAGDVAGAFRPGAPAPGRFESGADWTAPGEGYEAAGRAKPVNARGLSRTGGYQGDAPANDPMELERLMLGPGEEPTAQPPAGPAGPPELPPGQPTTFYQGRGGTVGADSTIDPAYSAGWTKPVGELPARASDIAAGIPPAPPMPLDEWLNSARLKNGNPLADLETNLYGETAQPGAAQGGFNELSRDLFAGKEPDAVQPAAVQDAVGRDAETPVVGGENDRAVYGAPGRERLSSEERGVNELDALERAIYGDDEPAARGNGTFRPEAVSSTEADPIAAWKNAQGSDRELAAPAQSGVDQLGGGQRSPARGRAAKSPANADAAFVDDLISKAVDDGYKGDPAELRSLLDDRVQMMKEINYEFDRSGQKPENLLRAIAKNGGLSTTREKGWPGEVRRLKDFQDNYGSTLKPRGAFGTIGGVRGVLNDRGGRTLDEMLEALGQDPSMSHIKSFDDLLSAIEDATRAPKDNGLETLLKDAGVEYGGRWWDDKGDTSFDAPTLDSEINRDLAQNPRSGNMWVNVGENAAVPTEYSYDALEPPMSAEEQAKVARGIEGRGDVLDTGETQNRLPEAGGVRDVEKATPEFDAPFSLSAPKNDSVDALEQSLFGGEQNTRPLYRVEPADVEGPIDPNSTQGRWFSDNPDAIAGKRYGGEGERSLKGVSVPADELESALRAAADAGASPKDAFGKYLLPRELASQAEEIGRLPSRQKPVENNVADYLKKQLGYTDAEIASMQPDEARRIGREQVAHPEREARKAPKPDAPVQALEERGSLPSMRNFDEVRGARGQQRRQALERTATPMSEPTSQPSGVAPKTPAERQAAGETLTAAERKSLNLPAETRERGRVSSREQGSSPRQIAQRVQRLDRWMDDPTPENFKRWVDEITGQAERVNTRQLKGGSGEEAMPPRSPSGEVLAGSPFPGFQILSDPRSLRAVWQFLSSDESADRLLRAAIGAGVGAFTDEDNRLRGAIMGGIAASVGPEVARVVANDFVMLAKGMVPKGLASVYNPRKGGDIGIVENLFGTKRHTVPEQFDAVRPAIEQLAEIRRTGKVDSRFPLTERLDEGGPAYKGGKMQIRQGTFLKPEIKYLRDEATHVGEKRPRMASYLNAFADELAGAMTTSETMMKEIGIPLKGTARASTEVANQVYRSGLAFNVGSAAVNRISQPLLTAPYVGLRNLWKNYAPLTEEEKGLTPIERPVDIADTPRAALSVLQKFDDFSSSLMRFTDNQNRQGAYAAAHLAAEQSGAPKDVADKFARDVSEKTQGLLGLLAGNPRWRGPVIKMVKPFTKYPILFAEWLNDVATSPDPRVRWRTAAMAGAAFAFSQATGVDVFDMLAGGARYGGSALLRGAMDVYAHATNQVRDHKLLETPGKGFLDSDVGSAMYPVGVRKVVDTTKRFVRSGLDTHVTRTPSGAREDVSPTEDLMNMFGVRTTRQTARRQMLDDAHAQETRQSSDEAQASAQAKRDFYRAVDAGDSDAMRDALLQMSPATRKNVIKTQNRDRFDRLLHTTPKRRRPELLDAYGQLEKELSLGR